SAWFAAGYLVAWTGFSLAATFAQWALQRAALLTPTMESASNVLGGVVLIAGAATISASEALSLLRRPATHRLRQLGDIGRNPSGLVARERIWVKRNGDRHRDAAVTSRRARAAIADLHRRRNARPASAANGWRLSRVSLAPLEPVAAAPIASIPISGCCVVIPISGSVIIYWLRRNRMRSV